MQHLWNERYAAEEFAYGTEANVFLAEQLPKIPVGKILFISEGEGRNAVFAAKLNWEVTAFDLSEEGKKKAELLAKNNRVELRYTVANATEINYPENYFDVLVFIYAHFPENIRPFVHERSIKWLKPGGTVLLEAFNPKQLQYTSGGPKEITMLYTPEILALDFHNLHMLYLKEETCVLNEGTYHQGEAAIVRMIGKKN